MTVGVWAEQWFTKRIGKWSPNTESGYRNLIYNHIIPSHFTDNGGVIMLFVCYPKCTTCQKAWAFLDAKGAVYDSRDIKTENPTESELRAWHAKSGLPLKRFFNTSGLQYKALELSKCY